MVKAGEREVLCRRLEILADGHDGAINRSHLAYVQKTVSAPIIRQLLLRSPRALKWLPQNSTSHELVVR
jgi:hypothetical protein